MSAEITYLEARRRLAELSMPRPVEHLSPAKAQGRVLAADVSLGGPLPAHDLATIDGFAVALEGDRSTFNLVADLVAGSAPRPALQPGQAVRLAPGAPIPPGARLVALTDTDQARQPLLRGGLTHRTQFVSLTVTVSAEALAVDAAGGRIPQGIDGSENSLVLRAGTRLSPGTIALAVQAGCRELAVMGLPRLAVVSTGPGLGEGQTPVAAALISAFISSLGLTGVHAHAEGSDAVLLRALLVRALDQAEIVITCGGVCGGERDLLPVLLPSLGMDRLFMPVACEPVGQVLLARRGDGKILLGLPSEPLDALIAVHLFLWPLLRRRLGMDPEPPWRSMPLAEGIAPGTTHRLRFRPVRLDDGRLRPLPLHSPQDLPAAVAGDGLIAVDPAGAVAGTMVPFLAYAGQEPGQTALLLEG